MIIIKIKKKNKRNWHEGRSRITSGCCPYTYALRRTKALFSAVVLSSCRGPCHEFTILFTILCILYTSSTRFVRAYVNSRLFFFFFFFTLCYFFLFFHRQLYGIVFNPTSGGRSRPTQSVVTIVMYTRTCLLFKLELQRARVLRRVIIHKTSERCAWRNLLSWKIYACRVESLRWNKNVHLFFFFFSVRSSARYLSVESRVALPVVLPRRYDRYSFFVRLLHKNRISCIITLIVCSAYV